MIERVAVTCSDRERRRADENVLGERNHLAEAIVRRRSTFLTNHFVWRFMKAVKVPVHISLSGKTMEFDGRGRCTAGC